MLIGPKFDSESDLGGFHVARCIVSFPLQHCPNVEVKSGVGLGMRGARGVQMARFCHARSFAIACIYITRCTDSPAASLSQDGAEAEEADRVNLLI